MIVEKTYSLNIDELSDEIGRLLKTANLSGQQQDNRVSPVPDMRTIRYYSGLGLVDRPAIAGRVAKYNSRHVLQLLAIKILQGASLPLAEIQEKLYGLSDSELEQIIAMYLDDKSRQISPVQPPQSTQLNIGSLVSWQEVSVESGLKIMAEQSWLNNLNATIQHSGKTIARAELHKKITEALDLLIGAETEFHGENI